ncbi:MAG: hypothetical protein ROZ00_10060 [Denitratisoma sp.]|nr:hypothetical protein [Denitratisoma sp.]
MTDDTGTIAKSGKILPSLLEKMADGKFLVLLLSFFLYLDIWLLRAGVDPTTLALDSGYEALKKVSVFAVVMFVLSYSLLMAGFFPILRKFIGLGQLHFRSTVVFSNQTPDGKRLSDWSMAFVVLSVYDAALGYFSATTEYRGLAVFVLNFLQADGIEIVIFRLSVFFLWLACAAFALEVDDPSATA